jgi:hypothetical protein
MDRFNLKKLNDEGVKECYQINISNRFSQSVGYYEQKHHKPWFDEKCLKLLDQMKQAKLQ